MTDCFGEFSSCCCGTLDDAEIIGHQWPSLPHLATNKQTTNKPLLIKQKQTLKDKIPESDQCLFDKQMENQINTWTTIHLHNAVWQMLFYFSAHERPWIKWPDRSEWVNNLTIQFVRMGVANDWVTDGRVRQCILSSKSTIWPGEPKTFIATSSNSCLLTPLLNWSPLPEEDPAPSTNGRPPRAAIIQLFIGLSGCCRGFEGIFWGVFHSWRARAIYPAHPQPITLLYPWQL